MTYWRRVTALLLMVVSRAYAADWNALEPYQQTLTRDAFSELVETVYAPSGALADYLASDEQSVSLFSTPAHTGAPLFVLRLAAGIESAREKPRTFMNLDEGTAMTNDASAPLRGLRIALDPGHIGGAWARMEERFFFVDRDNWFVQEAALNLLVARLLRDRLEAAGATVLMTRDDFNPVTDKRPDDFFAAAQAEVGRDPRFEALPDLFQEAARDDAVRKRQERLFYRASEIAARAERVNTMLKPDLTLCIHFNATEREDKFELVEENGLAVFVHGNYLPEELMDDEQKFHLFKKLLEGSHAAEMAVAAAVAGSLQEASGLGPSYVTQGGVMHPMTTNSLVYARNLAANRQYDGPVVFLEPYFMNNRVVYQRIQLGDYEGQRDVEGISYGSIFKEYANAVANGVILSYLVNPTHFSK